MSGSIHVFSTLSRGGRALSAQWTGGRVGSRADLDAVGLCSWWLLFRITFGPEDGDIFLLNVRCVYRRRQIFLHIHRCGIRSSITERHVTETGLPELKRRIIMLATHCNTSRTPVQLHAIPSLLA
jgi:hypothetical protein